MWVTCCHPLHLPIPPLPTGQEASSRLSTLKRWCHIKATWDTFQWMWLLWSWKEPVWSVMPRVQILSMTSWLVVQVWRGCWWCCATGTEVYQTNSKTKGENKFMETSQPPISKLDAPVVNWFQSLSARELATLQKADPVLSTLYALKDW